MEFDKKALYKSFWALALPMILQSVVTALVSATDALMLGYLNQSSLASITLAGQIVTIFNRYITALCVGSTALLAQYYGHKDYRSVSSVLHTALQASIIGGILFFSLSFFAPATVMGFYTNDAQLITIGTPYLRIVAFSFLFMSISQMYMNLMKNTGSAKLSSIFGTITVVLNIALNYVMIFGKFGCPALGAAGAAYATIISRAFELTLTLIVAARSKVAPIRISSLIRPDLSILKKFYRYTTPTLLQSMSWIIAHSMTVAIIGHLGSDLVSANSVAIIVFSFIESFSIGYSQASGIVAGHMLGRGELRQAKAAGDFLLKTSFILSCVCGGALILLAPAISSVFSYLTPEAISYMKQILCVCGVVYVGKFFNTMLSKGLFTAGGDISFLMKVDIINMWLVVLPLGLIAAFVLHLPPIVVYIVLNSDEYYKLFFMYRHYRQYRWVRNLTRKEWAPLGKHRDELTSHVVSNLPVGIMTIGEFGHVQVINKACTDILGISAKELEEQDFVSLFMNDPANEAMSDSIIEAVSDKQSPHEWVADYHIGGTVKHLKLRTFFVENDNYKMGVCLMLWEA